jgi:hypothetical protein
MDTPDQKEFDKLHRKLQKANATSKKALERYEIALEGHRTLIDNYHRTAADHGPKWKKVLAARDKHTAASKKAEDAFTALVEFLRKLPARR